MEIPEQKVNTESDMPKARTLMGDLADAAKGGAGSVVRATFSKSGELAMGHKNDSSSKKNLAFLVSAIILLIVGVLALYFALQPDVPVALINPPQPVFVLAESKKEINVSGFDRLKFAQAVQNEIVNAKINAGMIEELSLQGPAGVLSAKDFMRMIASRAPADMLSALTGRFFMGLYGENAEPVMVFEIQKYSDSAAAVASWEQTMSDDLFLPLGIDISSVNVSKFNLNFTDSIVNNRPARVIKDADGKIIMMYSFPTETTLAVARSEEALNELYIRLSAPASAR